MKSLTALLALLLVGSAAGTRIAAQHVASPVAGGLASAGVDAPRTLLLSSQALRFLQLQYRSFTTEFMGCMIGEVIDGVVVVHRIAPADVEPSHSTKTWVVPEQSCEEAGWAGTVGMIHSHPAGERCWYYFPATRVPSSDGQSFLRSGYPVDAIMCGSGVVWIGRNLEEQRIPLEERPSAVPR